MTVCGVVAGFCWTEVIRPTVASRGAGDILRSIDTVKGLPPTTACGTGSLFHTYNVASNSNLPKKLDIELLSKNWTKTEEDGRILYRKTFDGLWPFRATVRFQPKAAAPWQDDDKISVNIGR